MLRNHSIHILLEDLANICAPARADEIPQIGRVKMDWHLGGLGRDFLAGDEQETPGLLEEIPKFIERAQANKLGVLQGAQLNPTFEALTVSFERLRFGFRVGRCYPLIAGQQNIMIGNRQEIIAVGLVPFSDHLWIVISIAPKRVRVEITLPPVSKRTPGQLLGTGHSAQQPGDGYDQDEAGTRWHDEPQYKGEELHAARLVSLSGTADAWGISTQRKRKKQEFCRAPANRTNRTLCGSAAVQLHSCSILSRKAYDYF
jgi:hypothetical protein